MAKNLSLRAATPDDAADLAWFLNTAGKGLPLTYWSTLAAPDQPPWEVGYQRMSADCGDTSWRNWTIAERAGRTVGGLCSHLIPAQPHWPGADISSQFRPLVALEGLAAGTLYIHALATRHAARRMGVATALLAHADQQAQKRPQSVIVDSYNLPACALYRRAGFDEVARRVAVNAEGTVIGGNWLLLTR